MVDEKKPAPIVPKVSTDTKTAKATPASLADGASGASPDLPSDKGTSAAPPAGDVSGATVPVKGPAAPFGNKNPEDLQPSIPTRDPLPKPAVENPKTGPTVPVIDLKAKADTRGNVDVVMDTPDRQSSHDEQNVDRVVVSADEGISMGGMNKPDAPRNTDEVSTSGPHKGEPTPAHIDTTFTPDDPASPIIDIDENDPPGGKVVLGGGADTTLGVKPSPVGITKPLIAPFEDVANVTKLPMAELAKLDETDSARAAAIRRQASWTEDAKKIFKGTTEAETERLDHLSQMDAIDTREHKLQAEQTAARKVKEDRASAGDAVKALEAEYKTMVDRANFIKGEIVRLKRLLSKPDPDPVIPVGDRVVDAGVSMGGH